MELTVDRPLPTLLSAGSFSVPCPFDLYPRVDLRLRPTIYDLTDNGPDWKAIGDRRLRDEVAVILASNFEVLLAREDRIAACLCLPLARVEQMGKHLRDAGVWNGTELARDCYAEIMDADALKANVSLTLYAMVAAGVIEGRRDHEGMVVFQCPAKKPVHFHGQPCSRCGGTLRYISSHNCVACARKAVKRSAQNRRNKFLADTPGSV